MSLITVTKATVSKAAKGYPVVDLVYKADDGKIKSMKVLGFGTQKAIADAFSDAQSGEQFEVSFEKNDRGYWQFKNAQSTGVKQEVVAETTSGKTSKATGNWETSEERQARQVLIVRQSSVASAVAFLAAAAPKGTEASVGQMLDVAKQIEDYVFGKTQQPTGDIQ